MKDYLKDEEKNTIHLKKDDIDVSKEEFKNSLHSDIDKKIADLMDAIPDTKPILLLTVTEEKQGLGGLKGSGGDLVQMCTRFAMQDKTLRQLFADVYLNLEMMLPSKDIEALKLVHMFRGIKSNFPKISDEEIERILFEDDKDKRKQIFDEYENNLNKKK